jgi:hypothetical protein
MSMGPDPWDDKQFRNIAMRGESRSSRRQVLRQMAGVSLGLPLASWRDLSAWAQTAAPRQPDKGTRGSASEAPSPFSPQEEQFLDELEHSIFLYFWEQANPETGLIKDRCNARIKDTGIVGSIASTGFGLTAICIAEKRGFVSYADARLRVLSTLIYLWRKLPTHRGFFYHFANINTGERIWDSEVSSIDTTMLLCGILTCKQHFHDRDIIELAHAIFDRVDWSWISEDTSLLSQGWTPESGFLPYKWDYYSELMMIYLLGMGASLHPLRPEAWAAWKRINFEYEGLHYIGSFAPLFVHQYSQAWFDFRHKRDKYANYFQNSATATEAHKKFCLSLAPQYPDYSDNLWGITASDSDKGYVVWGGPPATGPIDGTVVPAAAGGSLPFLPEDTMRVLKNIRSRYPQAWSRYGFVDAFNPLKNWYDTDIVGIDSGIIMLMAENARTGFVWETFMKNPEAQKGMQVAGFKSDDTKGQL